MLKVKFTHRFHKEYKKIVKTEEQKQKLRVVIQLLQNEQVLPLKYKDHPLKGKWTGYRDCHIEPDWILIYRIFKKELILELVRTGSHSNILKK